MRTVAIVQARMASTRLPGKVMKMASGKRLIEHLVERLRRCESLDGIVLATTDLSVDDILAWQAHELGIGCYRGSSEDVLGRVLEAATFFGVDTIVEITADCPLINPTTVDSVVADREARECDLAANTIEVRDALRISAPAYPRGMDVRALRYETLRDMDARTTDLTHREHVSLYAWERWPRNGYRVRWVEPPPNLADDARLTVDTPEDLLLIRAIFDELYPQTPDFTLHDVLDLLDRRPELRRINDRVSQKAVR